jgi:hypothetical protein
MVDKVLELVHSCWSDNGIFVISNGWTDTANRPLVNLIVMSSSGSYLLRAIDASAEENVEWIAGKNSKAIEIMGLSNVVQVIIDNAHSCKAIGAIIEGLYENIFWTPSLVHSLNLASKSIVVEVEWMKTPM